jgi:hypothetical protein
MKFTNCAQVNIASNVSRLVGGLPIDSGPLLVHTAVAGDLVFEECKVVNILTPQDSMPQIQRRQSRSHRTMRRPVQSTREHRRPEPRRREETQGQFRSQGQPPAPPIPQHAQPNILPQNFGQSYLPMQIATQTQSYHPPPQIHTHDQYLSQAYHAGPNQAQVHAQIQPQAWPQAHSVGPTQTQVQNFYEPSQHAR